MNSSTQKIILHIDDDEDDRIMVHEAIKELDSNIIVKQADSGQAGIDLLKQAKQLNNVPCLIILDLNMPGMDGKQALKELKKDDVLASIPIVLFSTSSSPLDKMFADKERVALITKPSSTAAIRLIIKKILEHCLSQVK